MVDDDPTHEKAKWWDKLTKEEKAALRLRGKLKARVKQTGRSIAEKGLMIAAVASAAGSQSGEHLRIAAGGMALVQRDRHKLRRFGACERPNVAGMVDEPATLKSFNLGLVFNFDGVQLGLGHSLILVRGHCQSFSGTGSNPNGSGNGNTTTNTWYISEPP